MRYRYSVRVRTAIAAKDHACQSCILMSHPTRFHVAVLVPAREIAALQLIRAAAVTIPARLAHQLVKQLCAAHPLPAALKHLKRIRKAEEGGSVVAEGSNNAATAHASAAAAAQVAAVSPDPSPSSSSGSGSNSLDVILCLLPAAETSAGADAMETEVQVRSSWMTMVSCL